MEGTVTKEKRSKESKRPRTEKTSSSASSKKGLNVAIEVIERPGFLAGPLLSQFKGRLPSTTTLAAFKQRKERRDKERAPEYVLKGQSELMAYQATSALPLPNGALAPSEYKYLVGVYNKQTQQVSIIDTPFLDPQMRPARLVDSDTYGRTSKADYYDAKKELILAFGTKKRKSAMTSRERNQVDFSLLTSATTTLQSLVSTSKDEEKVSEANPSTGVEDLLPPHDSLTTLPDQIYPLSGLINSELLKAIGIRALLNHTSPFDASDFMASGKSFFINSEIGSAVASQATQNYSRIRLLIYVDWLLALMAKHTGDVFSTPAPLRAALLGRGRNAIEMPPVLARHICETYFEKGYGLAPGNTTLGNIYKLTSGSKLKLQVHIILLLLHLTDFKLDVNIPSLAMAIDTSKIRTLMKSVGCVFTRSSKGEKSVSGNFGVLRAPLLIPDLRKSKAKGKRQQ